MAVGVPQKRVDRNPWQDTVIRVKAWLARRHPHADPALMRERAKWLATQYYQIMANQAQPVEKWLEGRASRSCKDSNVATGKGLVFGV